MHTNFIQPADDMLLMVLFQVTGGGGGVAGAGGDWSGVPAVND